MIRKHLGKIIIIDRIATIKIDDHIPCGYSMSNIGAFYHIENKYTLHLGKDYMKKFCEFLRGHTRSVLIFKRNVTVNKRKTKVTSKCKSMLHLRKNNLKKAL